MIGIINRGQIDDDLHQYEIKINEMSIATFTHARQDGLAECLKKAAAAAQQYEQRREDELVERLTDAILDLPKR